MCVSRRFAPRFVFFLRKITDKGVKPIKHKKSWKDQRNGIVSNVFPQELVLREHKDTPNNTNKLTYPIFFWLILEFVEQKDYIYSEKYKMCCWRKPLLKIFLHMTSLSQKMLSAENENKVGMWTEIFTSASVALLGLWIFHTTVASRFTT